MSKELRPTLYGALAVGLALFVYAPLLRNYFFLDDFLIFELLTNSPLGTFLTMHWAGHLVVVRNAFYAGIYALAGADPVPYYAALLVLHGINVALIFAIVHTVTRSAALACLAAAAWGTSPMNEGALGWLAASGNVMVATTTLAVLYGAVHAVWRQVPVGIARAILWALLLLAGAQSFGTGLGVAIAAPVVLAWLAWAQLTRSARVILLAVPVVTALMYGADYSEFTGHLDSSLAAKADLLFHLHAIGLTNLLRGLAYEPTAAHFLAPATFKKLPPSAPDVSLYVVALVAVVAWVVAVVRASSSARRFLVALGILVLCNYGTVALGRAYFIELFRQPVALWAAQTRYHYSASALLAVGLAVVLATVFRGQIAVWPRVLLVAWLALSATLYARSGWTISNHDAERDLAERILQRIDTAIRETPDGQPVVTYNEPYPYGPHMGGAASLYIMHRAQDREIYFIGRGAVTHYRKYPASPLSRILLPRPSMPLACGPAFTLQSDTR